MATIKDVAKQAGVSVSTASRALHDNKMISEATKRRVRQAAENLDYSPNYSAQNLVNRTTNTVGIVLPVRKSQESLDNNPFFMQIIQGISSVCSENNYMVSLATGRTEQELQKNIQTLIRSGNIAKVIFLYSKKNDPVFDFVKKEKGISCLVVGESFAGSADSVFSVDNDNYQAGKDVTDFMLERGYVNLAFVYTDMEEAVQSERYDGYMSRFSDSLKAGQKLCLSLENQADNLKAVEHFLKQYPKTQAFLACDDMMAIRLQRLFKELNIDGNQYGMISFNNSLIAEIATPSLTSVDIFPYELGEKAAQILLNPLENSKKRVIINHKIIERQSTPRLMA